MEGAAPAPTPAPSSGRRPTRHGNRGKTRRKTGGRRPFSEDRADPAGQCPLAGLPGCGGRSCGGGCGIVAPTRRPRAGPGSARRGTHRGTRHPAGSGCARRGTRHLSEPVPAARRAAMVGGGFLSGLMIGAAVMMALPYHGDVVAPVPVAMPVPVAVAVPSASAVAPDIGQRRLPPPRWRRRMPPGTRCPAFRRRLPAFPQPRFRRRAWPRPIPLTRPLRWSGCREDRTAPGASRPRGRPRPARRGDRPRIASAARWAAGGRRRGGACRGRARRRHRCARRKIRPPLHPPPPGG